jgi:hypothetical protein
MKPSTEDIANDPTIMGNEKPRRTDDLPEGEEVQEEDPRNGMNRPVDSGRAEDSDDEKDEE